MTGLSFTTDTQLAQELAGALMGQAGAAGLGRNQVQITAPPLGEVPAARSAFLESIPPDVLQVVISGLVSGTLPAVAQIIASVLSRRKESWQVTISNGQGETRTVSGQNTTAKTFQHVLGAIMDLSAERPHHTTRRRGRPTTGAV